MGTVNATARRENDTTEEATLMDTACVTMGVYSEGMERLRAAQLPRTELHVQQKIANLIFDELIQILDPNQMDLFLRYIEETQRLEEIKAKGFTTL